MADEDHDKEDQGSTDGGTTEGGNDPWADLESDAGLDLTEGFSFSFEEVAADAILDEPFAGEEELLPPHDETLAGEDHLRVVDPAAAGAGGGEDTVDAASESEVSADDDLVNAWLEDPASDDAAGDVFSDALGEQQLAVFSPDESEDGPVEDEDLAAIDRSSIEIGTGESGVSSVSGVDEPGIEESGTNESGPDESGPDESGMDMLALMGDDPIEESPAIEESAAPSGVFPAVEDGAVAEHADLIDFGTAAAGMAVIGGVAASGGKPLVQSTAKAAKKSGLGPLFGVLLGGVMAIPVTLAILIWGLKQDPIGVTKQVPESLAFLLPAEFQKTAATAVAGGPDLSTANSLDDLPAAAAVTADAADREPPASEETAAVEPDSTVSADVAGHEAAVEPPSDTATLVAAEPVMDEPDPLGVGAADRVTERAETLDGEPAAPAAGDLAVAAQPQPSLDELETLMPAAATAPPAEPDVQVSPPEPLGPEPEPIDLTGIETAVAAAITSLDAVHAAADPASPARKTALVEWYKQLARVAEELAMLEHVAADSGRPLSEPPAAVAGLYAKITTRPELLDDLARLSRNWLAYAKRSGDGVVVPATFVGTKQVGPYWSSRVSLAEAGGKTREMAAISRIRPVADSGDLILLTGLALDGDVIWAADVRSATSGEGEGGTAGAVDRVSPAEQPDPFGLPGL